MAQAKHVLIQPCWKGGQQSCGECFYEKVIMSPTPVIMFLGSIAVALYSSLLYCALHSDDMLWGTAQALINSDVHSLVPTVECHAEGAQKADPHGNTCDRHHLSFVHLLALCWDETNKGKKTRKDMRKTFAVIQKTRSQHICRCIGETLSMNAAH